MQIKTIAHDRIAGSVYQPRHQTDRDLPELIESIHTNGLLVPVIVLRDAAAPAGYLLVCGHRRLAALTTLLARGTRKLPAGWARISRGKMMLEAVVLGSTSRKQAALTSFVENDHRVDLSPYEQAVCYRAFVDDFGFTRDELARRAQVNRTTLDYMIAALDGKSLTPAMIKAWKERKLGDKHVTTLYRLRHDRAAQRELFERILSQRLSAREAEFWCNQLLDPEDRRLDRRLYDAIEQRVLHSPALKRYIDDKKLHLAPTRRGERLDVRFESVSELRAMLQALLQTLGAIKD